jgi:hypothetical protein
MSTITLPPSLTPFPFTCLILATHLSVKITYDPQAKDISYGAVHGAEAVESELAGQRKGKEVRFWMHFASVVQEHR